MRAIDHHSPGLALEDILLGVSGHAALVELHDFRLRPSAGNRLGSTITNTNIRPVEEPQTTTTRSEIHISTRTNQTIELVETMGEEVVMCNFQLTPCFRDVVDVELEGNPVVHGELLPAGIVLLDPNTVAGKVILAHGVEDQILRPQVRQTRDTIHSVPVSSAVLAQLVKPSEQGVQIKGCTFKVKNTRAVVELREDTFSAGLVTQNRGPVFRVNDLRHELVAVRSLVLIDRSSIEHRVIPGVLTLLLSDTTLFSQRTVVEVHLVWVDLTREDRVDHPLVFIIHAEGLAGILQPVNDQLLAVWNRLVIAPGFIVRS